MKLGSINSVLRPKCHQSSVDNWTSLLLGRTGSDKYACLNRISNWAFPFNIHNIISILLLNVKGVDTGGFCPVKPQPWRQHGRHVQAGAHPQLPCLCRQGGSFQVLDFSLSCIYMFSSFSSYNQTDFLANPGPSGMEFKGPLWQPTRAFANLTAWSMFILVPIFYRAIFKFRRVHAMTAGKT